MASERTDLSMHLPLDRNRGIKMSTSKIVEELDNTFNLLVEGKEYIFLEKIGQEDAYNVMEKYENRACRVYFGNGLLKIRKLPSTIHETAASTIIKQLNKSRIEGFNTGSANCNIGTVIKQPDASFRPFERKTPGPYRNQSGGEFPTLVVEVAYQNEPIQKLKDELELWVSASTTVNIAIGIKIGVRLKKNGTHTITFLMFTRGLSTYEEKDLQCISETEIVKIPIQLLFQGSQILPDLNYDSFNLNLYEIKREINKILTEDY